MASLDKLFVYGTLKQGFCNFGINGGTRIAGDYVTVQPYGLFIVGDEGLPWLVDCPTPGMTVRGELYQVDEKALVRMDQLEQVDDPGWYSRHIIKVCDMARPDTSVVEAYVYFGSPGALQTRQVHLGPVAEFSLALQTRFRTVP